MIKLAKLLYITVNPKPVNESYSLTIGEAFLQTYQENHSDDEILKLDLYNIDLPYIDTDVFNGWGKLQSGNEFHHLSADEQMKVSKINDLTDQFIDADKYVFVTPFWNFSFPPKLKAYIDTIAIAGKTFKYTDQGPVGLLTDKKALHIQARGGVYSEGPAKEMEFGDRYLHAVLGFLGIPSVESVIAEGMAQMPEKAEEIKTNAIDRAHKVALDF